MSLVIIHKNLLSWKCRSLTGSKVYNMQELKSYTLYIELNMYVYLPKKKEYVRIDLLSIYSTKM